MKNHVAVVLLTAGFLTSLAKAENWPQWRGPHFDGSSQSKNLPERLDDSTRLWESPLPGGGSGSPVVWGDRLFVSCLDSNSKKLLAICLSTKDGTVIWSKEVGLGFRQNDRNDMASPSPVTDGKMVWFYFGTGDLAAFDTAGNEKWSRNIQKDYGDFNVQWIYASSPLLYKDKLYIQVLQRDVPPFGRAQGPPADSYLLAIDPQTGKDIWRVVRPNEAIQESKESYGTPIPFENGGHNEILLVGGDCITAHDPQTGKELWRAGGWNPQKIGHWRMVSSPVAAAGLVFVCPPKGGAVFAVKDGGEGDVTQTNIAWKNPELTSDVCVPLIYKDHLYVLNGDGRKTISCADPKTGKVIWSGVLGGNAVFRASPTGADCKIYCLNERGDVWVLATDEFKILSKSSLGGERSRATIAVVDGAVFVRSGEKLSAFANK